MQACTLRCIVVFHCAAAACGRGEADPGAGEGGTGAAEGGPADRWGEGGGPHAGGVRSKVSFIQGTS